MKIIVGLGNPGTRYENTRHNVGFLTLDVLANKFNCSFERENFKGKIAETRYNGEKIILLKPQTFMNLSGEAVVEILNFYKAEMEDVLIIYDDMDLPNGALKFKTSGSGGGHNGMNNIISLTGTNKIPRLKIGIDRPFFNNSADYVLQMLNGETLAEMVGNCKKAADGVICWIEEGISKASNEFN